MGFALSSSSAAILSNCIICHDSTTTIPDNSIMSPLMALVRTAVQVYYKEGTEMAVNTGRRIGVIGAWVERATQRLGPVTLPNGEQIDRVIESWIPKKRINAVNPKCASELMQQGILLALQKDLGTNAFHADLPSPPARAAVACRHLFLRVPATAIHADRC